MWVFCACGSLHLFDNNLPSAKATCQIWQRLHVGLVWCGREEQQSQHTGTDSSSGVSSYTGTLVLSQNMAEQMLPTWLHPAQSPLLSEWHKYKYGDRNSILLNVWESEQEFDEIRLQCQSITSGWKCFCTLWTKSKNFSLKNHLLVPKISAQLA